MTQGAITALGGLGQTIIVVATRLVGEVNADSLLETGQRVRTRFLQEWCT